MSYRAVDFEVSTIGEISLLNFFVLHETKYLSRVNEFECGCTQTLDKPFSLMQFCRQQELRQRMP